MLPANFALVGFGRRDWTDEDFGKLVGDSVREHARTQFSQEVWDRLAEGIRFVQGTFDDEKGFQRLAETLEKLDAERGTGGNHAFYLSIPPNAFQTVCEELQKSGLARPQQGRWSRVVIEKPFGHDLASAQELNNTVNSVFPEESVFRIDHYLGKETVQNILALRFANNLYEPIWNNNYVDSVQITMAEDIGLGGRGGYYDGVGAARDVIQNHLIQLMALTAMEEPVNFSPNELQAEKIKVLGATRPMEPLDETTARGQYAAGWQGSEKVPGLLEEEGFSKDSKTETYAAIALEIDTRRWAGVPFFLRTGKRLGRRVTEIALLFKRAPHLPFDSTMTEELGKNALVIRVQPDEGITLRFGSKVPGSQMEVRDVNMDFSYGSAFAEDSPEAYERLILDMLLGEPSLFPVNREVELSWEILDPVLDHWAEHGKPDAYESGTWGPESASRDDAPHGSRMEAAVMIVELPGTTTNEVNKKITGLREEGGALTLSRVLTLVIALEGEDGLEDSIEAANFASREHPCRVIVVLPGDRKAEEATLDAEIRVGADAGAGEVVVLRLNGELADHASSVVLPFLLPDTPVVAWWPVDAPAVPAQDPLGQLAIRRITDATNCGDPLAAIKSRAQSYTAGDTDLAWSRITYWRALLASALDQAPYEPVQSAVVSGLADEPALDILAGWLAGRIDGTGAARRR